MSAGLTQAPEDLRRSAATDLKDLRRSWGSAYEIAEDLGVWRAVRRDSQVTLIATGPGELRDLITANYTARPVPRPAAASRPRPGTAAPDPHPLMTPGEVCDALQVGYMAVWRLEQAGDLGCIHLPGGGRRYLRAEIEALARGETFTPEQVRAERERAASWPLPRQRAEVRGRDG